MDGDSPLHICESPQVAEYLLANGADEQALNTEGKSVYEQAVELENDAMVVFWAARMGLTVTFTDPEQEQGQEQLESVQEEAAMGQEQEQEGSGSGI
jgi:phosphoenolpyruvate carboxylase